MNLAGLRKLAVRERNVIRFTIPQGIECLLDEHGVLRLPSLQGAPDFNVESELASVREFHLEPSAPQARRRTVTPAELAAMVSAITQPAPIVHEDE